MAAFSRREGRGTVPRERRKNRMEKGKKEEIKLCS